MNLNQLKNRRASQVNGVADNEDEKSVDLSKESEDNRANGGHPKMKKDKLMPIDHLKIKSISNRALN